jgi:catecholate siderophore receptor
MRGFDTSSSLFVDGIRDLGSVSRDLFNIEQVEVVKGPAGTDNGRTAPSGAINMVSKQAMLHDAIAATLSGGNEGQQRERAALEGN